MSGLYRSYTHPAHWRTLRRFRPPTFVAPPSPPGTATANNVNADSLEVQWTAGAGAVSYKIERSLTFAGVYTQVASGITRSDLTWRDSGLTPGTEYYYRVISTGPGGDSAPTFGGSNFTNAVTQKANTFDGQADETAWTIVNSDDTSGDQLTMTGTPLVMVYDSDVSISGGALRLAVTATGNENSLVHPVLGTWSLGYSQYARGYFRTNLAGANTTVRIAALNTSLGRYLSWLTNTSKFAVVDGSGNPVATSTGTYDPVSAFVRLEIWNRYDGSTYFVDVRIFAGANLHGSTPDETFSYSVADTASSYTATLGVQLGGISDGGPTNACNIWWDEIKWSDDTWIGPVSTTHTGVLGLATETDTGQAITRQKIKTLGLATETDTPQSITRVHRLTTGLATETDTPLAITKIDPILRVIGQAVESDLGQALVRLKRKLLGQGTEGGPGISDDFNRADGALGPYDQTSNAFTVVSNQASAATVSASIVALHQTPLSPDHYAQFTYRGAANSVGLIVRADTVGTSTATSGSWYNLQCASFSWTLRRKGAFTATAPSLVSGSWSLSSGDVIRLVADGDRLIVLRNGVEVSSFRDAAPILTQTRVGIYTAPVSGTEVLDDFVAGNTQAHALIPRKIKALGQATEADSGQAVTRRKVKALGLATEVDSALRFVQRFLQPVGQATEVDTGQAVTARKIKALGQATESDSPQTITRRKVRALGEATETDAGQAVARRKVKILGQATEADTPQALSSRKTKALNQATEADSSLTLTRVHRRTVGLATETDTAQTVSHRKIKLLGLSTEIEFPLPLVATGSTRILGLATETNSALALRAVHQRTLTLPTESDTGQAVRRVKVLTLGLAVETETPRSLQAAKRITLGQVAELEQVQALSTLKTKTLGLATELDEVLAIVPPVPPVVRDLHLQVSRGHGHLLQVRMVGQRKMVVEPRGRGLTVTVEET